MYDLPFQSDINNSRPIQLLLDPPGMKEQLAVILSSTKHAKVSIFVGPKEETLAAFRKLLLNWNQWTDYVEDVLNIVTINSKEILDLQHTFTQSSFPYRIADVCLPQCNTGYVYMLLLLGHQNCTYIGTKKCITNRIMAHNCGRGATETTPTYLRPFALLAYIWGFGETEDENCDSKLHFAFERKWKKKRDRIIINGISDKYEWAKCGNIVIDNMIRQNDRFDVS